MAMLMIETIKLLLLMVATDATTMMILVSRLQGLDDNLFWVLLTLLQVVVVIWIERARHRGVPPLPMRTIGHP